MRIPVYVIECLRASIPLSLIVSFLSALFDFSPQTRALVLESRTVKLSPRQIPSLAPRHRSDLAATNLGTSLANLLLDLCKSSCDGTHLNRSHCALGNFHIFLLGLYLLCSSLRIGIYREVQIGLIHDLISSNL